MGEGNTQQLVKTGNISNYDITNEIFVQKYKISHLFFGSIANNILFIQGHFRAYEDRSCPGRWSVFEYFLTLTSPMTFSSKNMK